MHEPPVLAVMTKAPVCGAVNTRLASEIGPVAATALARTLTVSLLREVARDPRFRTVLAISPDEAVFAPFAGWRVSQRGTPRRPKVCRSGQAKREPGSPKGLRFKALRSRIRLRLSGMTATDVERGLFPQGRGGLGQRMQRIFDRCGRGSSDHRRDRHPVHNTRDHRESLPRASPRRRRLRARGGWRLLACGPQSQTKRALPRSRMSAGPLASHSPTR